MPKFVGAIDVNGAYTLPTADGSADQVLTTNGSGTVSFADAAGGGASVTISDSAPSSPSAGNLWFESDTGKTFIYYGDGSSNQWVEIGGASGIAGGSDHHVQFNNVGSLSGSSNFTFDGSAAVLKSTLTVGVDDTGHDVTFFGATASSKLFWDESADTLYAENSKIKIFKDSGNAIFQLRSAHDTESSTGIIEFLKEDGSLASPAAVDDNATLGRLDFYGYDGDSYALGARLRVLVDGTPGDGDMPTEMLFQVSPDGSSSPVTAVTIKPTGETRFTADKDITSFAPNASSSPTGILSLYNTDGAVNDYTCLDFIGNGTDAAARIGMKYTGSGSELLFGTSNSYGNGITKAPLKINYDGRIGIRDDAEAGVITNRMVTMRTQTVGMTALLAWAEYDVSAANGTAGIFMIGDSGDSTNPDTGDYWLLFRRGNGTTIGSVRGTGSASVNFLTTSDQTMKNDLGDAGDVGSLIDALKIHKFTWKDAKAEVGEQFGVFAQEVLDISEMPYGIATPSETRKEENEEGVEEDIYYPAGIDYGKLVPLLVQEIKSLRQRVASLEA